MEWISVEERLPLEHDMDFLVICKRQAFDPVVRFAEFFPATEPEMFGEFEYPGRPAYWDVEWGNYDIIPFEVTHWGKIPKVSN